MTPAPGESRGSRAPALARRPPAGRGRRLLGAGLSLFTAFLAATCYSGPVLRGYPGYPFQSFTAPAPPDSAFLQLEDAVEAIGFPLDYSRRAEGLINTKPKVVTPDSAEMFLNIVIGAADSTAGSRVWIAGYRRSPTGAIRVNPDDAALWTALGESATRLSEALGGTRPRGPGGT